MEMKKNSPSKPSQRLDRRSSIGFSVLSKSFMSTPLISRSNKIRRNSSRIVTLTPKAPTSDKSSLTAKVPNINIEDEGVKNDLEKILDHSISEAHVTLDVSGTDWKSLWLEKRTKTQRKRKIDWSEEDQTVIDKLNETRKKICLGLSSISSTAFETIKESDEYEEEELENENDYGEDSASVQVIEDKTLVDSASVEVIEENTLVDDDHKTDDNSSPTGKKAQITENKNGKSGVDKDNEGTIVLDDTQEPSDNPDIEDGEIVDDTQDESIIGHCKSSPEKLKTKFTVTIPPHFKTSEMVMPSSKIHRTGLLPTPSFNPSTMVMPTLKIHRPGLLPTPSFNPFKMVVPTSKIHQAGLRPIVIDGSNVAFAHAKSKPPQKNQNGNEFSCRGIKLVVEYFERRGHEDIVAFVPAWRKKMGKSQETHLLEELERKGVLAFTPSREVGAQFIASHDDRFILEYATKHGGVVVTRDNFRDHFNEVPEWRDTIQQRLLQPTFVRGELMFPDDPMGKDGASLEKFLKF